MWSPKYALSYNTGHYVIMPMMKMYQENIYKIKTEEFSFAGINVVQIVIKKLATQIKITFMNSLMSR